MCLSFFAQLHKYEGKTMSRQFKVAVLFLASFCFFSANANTVAIQKNSPSIIAVKYDVVQQTSTNNLKSSAGRIFVFPRYAFSNNSHLYYNQLKGAVKSGIEVKAVKVDTGHASKWLPVSQASTGGNKLVSSADNSCRFLSDSTHPMKVTLSTVVGKDKKLTVLCSVSPANPSAMTF